MYAENNGEKIVMTAAKILKSRKNTNPPLKWFSVCLK